MENLNAEQIKKALECCTGDDDCNRCPYWEGTDVNCFDNVKSDALALITSQEQRIEELTEENERLKRLCELRERDHNDALDLLYKAEADTLENIKIQFAMRYGTYTDKDMTPIIEVFRLLDKIAKELEGE